MGWEKGGKGCGRRAERLVESENRGEARSVEEQKKGEYLADPSVCG